MDLLIALLRFAEAALGFATGVMRVLSAASESSDEKKKDR